MAKPLSAMTILELTRLMSAQDDRWAQILTYAQSTRHPRAREGIAFFRQTWRPVLGDYFQNVVTRYDSAANAPMHVTRAVLDKMADVVYPAARAVGLTDPSFLIPDITIEKRNPATLAGYTHLGAVPDLPKHTVVDQAMAIPLEDRRKLGVSSTEDALTYLKGFRKNLTDPKLAFRESKADIAGYDLLVDSSRASYGFGLIDDARVATIPRGYFETLDAAAIAVGGRGFVTTNIAQDQSADLIRRLGDRLSLTEYQDMRRLKGTVEQVRQKVDSLIQLGEQKLVAERGQPSGAPVPTAAALVKSSLPVLAIGLGVVGIGLFAVMRHGTT